MHDGGIEAFRVEADLGKKGFQVADPLGSIDISFQEMTLALQSAGYEDTVNSPFKCSQHIGMIKFSGA